MESPDLAALRAEYAREGLDEADAGADPVALFARWLDNALAAGIHEPNAMALATADAAGRPSVRTVLLWRELQRQVRIEGRVERVDAAQSDAYFASRPRGAQIGAVASRQSQPIENREALEARVADAERAFDGRDVERPEQWGGFRITLEVMEFWQGRPNRIHDRLRFARVGEEWSRERLQP